MSIRVFQEKIVKCRACPRLVSWREEVAHVKKAAFRKCTYWGRPVPGFGDTLGKVLIVGLAPAAHGANRTGRMFTGDRSGDWLFRALHTAKFSNQAESNSLNDNLKLKDVYVTAIVRCAPPENKPTIVERNECLKLFIEELELLKNVYVIVALGKFAWDGILKSFDINNIVIKPKPKFGHGVSYDIGKYFLIGSYHPSQQNTFTGRLTEKMFGDIFVKVREKLS